MLKWVSSFKRRERESTTTKIKFGQLNQRSQLQGKINAQNQNVVIKFSETIHLKQTSVKATAFYLKEPVKMQGKSEALIETELVKPDHRFEDEHKCWEVM